MSLKELPVANPTHGTFWVEGTCKVASIHTNTESKEASRPALTIAELVEANEGQHLSVLVAGEKGADEWVHGVVSIPVFVREDSIPGSIKMVKGAKHLSYRETEDSKGLIVRLHPQPVVTTLRVMLLTNNFTWAPRYKMILTDQTAHVSAQACIINDSVAIKEFEFLACLAGVPNLAFSHVIEPMAQMSECSVFLSQLSTEGGGAGRGGQYGAQMMTRNYMSNMMQQQAYGGGGGGDDVSESLPQDGADDLYQYRFSKVPIPKGSRVLLDMFASVSIPFRDVHQAELSLTSRPQQKTDASTDVWHSIKLNNLSKIPWTTGPVLVTKNEEQSLVCQSSVTYTAPLAEAQIKLTKVMSVLVNHEEAVLPSSRNETKKILDRQFLKISAAGSFLLRNRKPIAVALCLTVNVTGELVESSINPAKNTEVGGSDLANASRVITWEVTLQPNESKSIKYSRFYYVNG